MSISHSGQALPDPLGSTLHHLMQERDKPEQPLFILKPGGP
jgi:hypothetical protein